VYWSERHHLIYRLAKWEYLKGLAWLRDSLVDIQTKEVGVPRRNRVHLRGTLVDI
jgi:hypothetical protein